MVTFYLDVSDEFKTAISLPIYSLLITRKLYVSADALPRRIIFIVMDTRHGPIYVSADGHQLQQKGFIPAYAYFINGILLIALFTSISPKKYGSLHAFPTF